MKPQTMAAAFTSARAAYVNSLNNGNGEWVTRWRVSLAKLVELIPSGGGIDRGPRTWDDVEISSNAIRFEVGYHHMNENGFYDGWTDHTIVIRPAFDGVEVRVSGRNRGEVKDMLHQTMEHAFTRHVTWDEQRQHWTMESDDDRCAAMERAYPDHCSNPECPKLFDDDACHVDGACERRNGPSPRGLATW